MYQVMPKGIDYKFGKQGKYYCRICKEISTKPIQYSPEEPPYKHRHGNEWYYLELMDDSG